MAVVPLSCSIQWIDLIAQTLPFADFMYVFIYCFDVTTVQIVFNYNRRCSMLFTCRLVVVSAYYRDSFLKRGKTNSKLAKATD